MRIHRIMVSNIALPSKKIGSWTNLFDFFNSNDSFFDFVLSPGAEAGKYIHCTKRSWPYYFHKFKRFFLVNWVARDYLKTIQNLSKKSDLLKIVVQDDIALLESISLKKFSFDCKIELILYFHGFHLTLPKHVDELVDKVFFLSNSSYKYTLKNNLQFTPEAYIVGNFILNTKFFIPAVEQKVMLKESLNIPSDSIVIVWMANDRRVKGLHLFEKIAKDLLSSFPELLILVIGSSQEFSESNSRLRHIGRINHDLVPQYLQVSDFYFFPSLWKEGFGLSVVEALLCGNWIITTSSGSLFEILNNSSKIFFVKNPNIIQNWIDEFHKAYKIFQTDRYLGPPQEITEFSYENWLVKFKTAVG